MKTTIRKAAVAVAIVLALFVPANAALAEEDGAQSGVDASTLVNETITSEEMATGASEDAVPAVSEEPTPDAVEDTTTVEPAAPEESTPAPETEDPPATDESASDDEVDRPEKPEPVYEKRGTETISCGGSDLLEENAKPGFYSKIYTYMYDWVWNNENAVWEPEDEKHLVGETDWQFVRDLTSEEKESLGCASEPTELEVVPAFGVPATVKEAEVPAWVPEFPEGVQVVSDTGWQSDGTREIVVEPAEGWKFTDGQETTFVVAVEKADPVNPVDPDPTPVPVNPVDPTPTDPTPIPTESSDPTPEPSNSVNAVAPEPSSSASPSQGGSDRVASAVATTADASAQVVKGGPKGAATGVGEGDSSSLLLGGLLAVLAATVVGGGAYLRRR